MRFFQFSMLAAVSLSSLLGADVLAGDDYFADVVVAYDLGVGGHPAYTNPLTTLGSPERFTGEGIFPAVVSPFNAPWGSDEIVSLGAGGFVTVKFNFPVVNDPNNLYGIDLLIFGNTAFIDAEYPSGIVGGMFSNDGGVIEVSADGKDWRTIVGPIADGPMPTMGYVDSGPYDESPGRFFTDFTRPVDPALTLNHFMGLNHVQVRELYRGAGGGVGVDIGSVGLAQISYVRVSNPANAKENIEIDAFSDVWPRRMGDVNLDGIVNVNDLLLVINGWGVVAPGDPPADFNNDGLVNVNDLLMVINNWG